MNVEVKTLEPMCVAFMRHVGPYHEVGETWQQFMAFVAPRALFGPNAHCLGLCHDDPDVTPADKIRYDACLTVPDSFEPEGDVGVQTIPAGRFASTLHEGPYDNLNQTYAALLGQWFPAHGHEPAAASCLEFYLNSPEDTEPEDLLTEVCVRIQD